MGSEGQKVPFIFGGTKIFASGAAHRRCARSYSVSRAVEKQSLMQVQPTIGISDVRWVDGEPNGVYFCKANALVSRRQNN
jgi:hypothetical protein